MPMYGVSGRHRNGRTGNDRVRAAPDEAGDVGWYKGT